MRGFLVLLAALVTLTGCSFGAAHMHPATPRPIVPDPASATLVFVRPSSLGAAITPVIASVEGKFLGESEANRYFVVKLPPGEHLLLSWSEGTPAMQANVSAGMIYYVEVAPKMGFGSARVQLLALGPRRENWPKLAEWMADASPIEAEEAAAAAYLRERAADFAERVKAAQESYKGYSAEERDARTLKPEDAVQRAVGGGGDAAPALPAGGVPVAPPTGAAPPAASAPAPSSAAPKASAVDTVVLKSGAKYRGTVMEDEPAKVSIKLLDGTTKMFKRPEIDHVDYGK